MTSVSIVTTRRFVVSLKNQDKKQNVYVQLIEKENFVKFWKTVRSDWINYGGTRAYLIEKDCERRQIICSSRLFQIRVRVQSEQNAFLFFEIVKTEYRFFFWIQSGYFFKLKINFVQIESWFIFWTRKPNNLDQKKFWTTFAHFWSLLLIVKESSSGYF